MAVVIANSKMLFLAVLWACQDLAELSDKLEVKIFVTEKDVVTRVLSA